MNSTQLGIFISLAEHLNFSKTAATLYVSQSHVSKQIAKLEEEWNVQLFLRNHHSVTLTPAGTLMYEYVLDSQRQLRDAIQRARDLQAANYAQLRIGVLSQINFRQAPEVIRSLRAENPAVQITMEFDTEEQLMSDLWDGKYDLIVTNRDAISHWPSICYKELWHGNYHISISIDEVPATQEINEMDWLAEKRLITVSDATNISTRNLLEKMRMKFDFSPGARLEAPNLEALYRMVESGMGFAFVETVPNNTPKQPRLAFINTGIAYSIGMAWKTSDNNTMIERFTESILSTKESRFSDNNSKM